MSKNRARDGEEQKKKKSVPVLIIDIIITVVFLFAVGCLLTIVVETAMGRDPSLFGYRMMVVLTDSMTGTYDRGDVIIVDEFSSAQLSSPEGAVADGDVVTFVAPEGFGDVAGYNVTHRVIEAPYLEDGVWYIRTQGDASPAADPVPVPVSALVGKVVGHSEALAGLHSFFVKPYGFIVLIVVPLLAVLIWQIAYAAKESGKAKAKRAREEAAARLDEAEKARVAREEELKRQAVEEYLRGKSDKDNEDNEGKK